MAIPDEFTGELQPLVDNGDPDFNVPFGDVNFEIQS